MAGACKYQPTRASIDTERCPNPSLVTMGWNNGAVLLFRISFQESMYSKVFFLLLIKTTVEGWRVVLERERLKHSRNLSD